MARKIRNFAKGRNKKQAAAQLVHVLRKMGVALIS